MDSAKLINPLPTNSHFENILAKQTILGRINFVTRTSQNLRDGERQTHASVVLGNFVSAVSAEVVYQSWPAAGVANILPHPFDDVVACTVCEEKVIFRV